MRCWLWNEHRCEHRIDGKTLGIQEIDGLCLMEISSVHMSDVFFPPGY